MKKVLLILGSVRAGRVCPQIADWVIAELPKRKFSTEQVDLAEWHLPMDDEPGLPARDGDAYVKAHTRAWSEKIDTADGFIFVTPQYNWGYPAPLKNAIDHLAKEWQDKPAMIVSYGVEGGTKSASQLRQVFDALKMRPTAADVALTITPEMHDGEGRFHDASGAFADSVDILKVAAGELSALLATAAAQEK